MFDFDVLLHLFVRNIGACDSRGMDEYCPCLVPLKGARYRASAQQQA